MDSCFLNMIFSKSETGCWKSGFQFFLSPPPFFFFFFFLCPTNQLHLSIKINGNLDLEYLDSLCFWILNSDSNFFFYYANADVEHMDSTSFFSFLFPLQLAISLSIFFLSSLLQPFSLSLSNWLYRSSFLFFPLSSLLESLSVSLFLSN